MFTAGKISDSQGKEGVVSVKSLSYGHPHVDSGPWGGIQHMKDFYSWKQPGRKRKPAAGQAVNSETCHEDWRLLLSAYLIYMSVVMV